MLVHPVSVPRHGASLAGACAAAALLAVGCTAPMQPSAEPAPTQPPVAVTAPPLTSAIHSDQTVDPTYRGLTADQKLDRVLSLPGRRGFVKGVLGQPKVTQLPGPRADMPTVVTDYPFHVNDFVGRGATPYAPGSTITVRVPGGSINGLTVTAEDAPQLAPGQTLYVDVRDQGEIAGGNTASVQVVSSTADIFEVRNGVVVGRGAWANFSEDEATFRRHFTP